MVRSVSKWVCVLSVAVASAFMGACEENVRVNQSPLATWDPGRSDTFLQTSSGEGSLDISEQCALLILESRKSLLLVWPEPTSWNESTQVIEFVSVFGERLELREGDIVVAGGSTPVGEQDFVSVPDPSCRADEMFVLNSIRIVSD